jgi:hypothetical protein
VGTFTLETQTTIMEFVIGGTDGITEDKKKLSMVGRQAQFKDTTVTISSSAIT